MTRARRTCCSRPRTPPGRPTTTTAATACTPARRHEPGRAYKVSYNRPFNTRGVDGGQDWVFNAEYPMVRWLEANGYDVSYITGVDSRSRRRTAAQPQGLPVGRSRRVLVRRPAGQRRGGARCRRPPRVLQRQRGLLEDALGDQHRRLEHRVPHARLLQGDARQREDRSVAGVDRHLARPALQPAVRRRPARERADRARSSWSTTPAYRTRSWCRPPTARCVSGATPRVASLAAGQTATLPVGTLGYEWDSELDNGARPPGLMAPVDDDGDGCAARCWTTARPTAPAPPRTI